jgi:hypothetical protein
MTLILTYYYLTAFVAFAEFQMEKKAATLHPSIEVLETESCEEMQVKRATRLDNDGLFLTESLLLKLAAEWSANIISPQTRLTMIGQSSHDNLRGGPSLHDSNGNPVD